MNEDLSQLVAGLYGQAIRGEDLSSGISRVRAAIIKVIEGGDTIFGRFHALVESFREVLPEEKQRYQASIKALSATSKLNAQEIVAAVNKHLGELKILEKVLIFTLPRPDELKAMEARSQKISNEISRLREETTQLEKEEKEIADSMAGQGKETAAVEKALRGVFADITAEITSVKEKLEELRVGSTAQQPIPDTGITTDLARKKQGNGQISIAGQLSSHNDTKPQKMCPLCGAQMSFSATRNRWQCFSCAHEEPEKDELQSKNGELSADAIFPEPTPVSALKQNGEKGEQRTTLEPASGSELKQKCSMCGGRMDYYAAAAKWQCYSCGFEYTKNEIQGKSEEKSDRSNALLAIPASESLFDRSSTTRPSPGYWGPKKESPPSKKLPAITKSCPACGKTMHSAGSGKAWQCRYCGYERRI